MPNQVTITLTDTPSGGVAIKTDFTPAIGQRVTPCQQHALDIIARTHRVWGVDTSAGGVKLQAPKAEPVEHHHV